MLIAFVGVALLTVALFSQQTTFRPGESANNTTPQTAADSSANAEPTAQATETTAIQIYNSGAGDQAVNDVKELLEGLGYEVKLLGNSQFEYESTFIWHRPIHLETAEQLKELLEDRQVTLRESQISGVFEVLIYLGKN